MKNLFLVALVAVSTLAFANNNEAKEIKTTSIKGKVIDGVENLTGVKITIDNRENIVYTDFDGNFSLENIPVGTHKISLSLVTYENKVVEIDLSKENNFEIVLQSK